ncbi:MAG TPA: hypothetical protein VHG08_25940 [Longimicrobium sp.]|nr:hypothetical protein [Longimicrobium sp.]
MDDRPIDLSPLDPDEDPWRRDRVVGGAMARVRALQRVPAQPWAGWLPWWRPVVAFAALTMAVSGAVLASTDGGEGAAWSGAAAGVPQPVAEWMASGGLPSAAEVYAAVQGYR